MEALPIYVSLFFSATSLLTLFFFYRASGNNKKILALVIAWLILQSVVALSGFYQVTDTLPPRLVLTLLPPILLIIFTFNSKKGKTVVDRFDQRWLTFLHVIRVPVELVLFWLCSYKLVPELITFEGVNFDIVSGVTAPFVWYFGYVKKTLSTAVLLLWNFVCLGLLLNVVIHALLAAPTVFQQLAFDQPTVAISYFPFTWLPCFVVMVVLFAHLVCIRQLFASRKQAPVLLES